MILNPKGTQFVFEKKDMCAEDRNELRGQYGTEMIYYCTCNHKVSYKLSKDNRFYPCKRNVFHESNCSESNLYKTSNKRMSAYKEDEDNGKISAKIIDRNRRQKSDGFPLTTRGRRCHETLPYLSLEGYMETLFLSAYETMKRSIKMDKKDVFKIVYAKLCNTEAIYNGKKMLMKSDETPFKIFYGRLANIEKKNNNDKEFYTLTLNEREIDVSSNDLEWAIKSFKERYNSNLKIPLLCVVRRFKSKYRIEKAYFSDTKIIFYPISNMGCVCSSAYQQNAINEIEEAESGQNSWYFYRPYEYGYGAFGDKYLEDGIINFRNKSDRICIEFTEDLNKEKIKQASFIDDGKYKLLIFDENKPFSLESVYSGIKAISQQ